MWLIPGISGRELAEALRARDAGLKVLFQSGHAGDTVAHHGVVYEKWPFCKNPSLSMPLLKSLGKS